MREEIQPCNAHRPWVVVVIMPQQKPRPIGRYANRSDAEATLRFLQRKVPNGAFYVIFDPAEPMPLPFPTEPFPIHLHQPT